MCLFRYCILHNMVVNKNLLVIKQSVREQWPRNTSSPLRLLVFGQRPRWKDKSSSTSDSCPYVHSVWFEKSLPSSFERASASAMQLSYITRTFRIQEQYVCIRSPPRSMLSDEATVNFFFNQTLRRYVLCSLTAEICRVNELDFLFKSLEFGV